MLNPVSWGIPFVYPWVFSDKWITSGITVALELLRRNILSILRQSFPDWMNIKKSETVMVMIDTNSRPFLSKFFVFFHTTKPEREQVCLQKVIDREIQGSTKKFSFTFSPDRPFGWSLYRCWCYWNRCTVQLTLLYSSRIEVMSKEWTNVMYSSKRSMA